MEGAALEWNYPARFGGNPAYFSFFREQTRTYLESDLLTDPQCVEYRLKILVGDALEVVKRNQGCSYAELMKTV